MSFTGKFLILFRGGYAFAGVQYSTECHCGQTFGRYERLPDSACDHPCPESAAAAAAAAEAAAASEANDGAAAAAAAGVSESIDAAGAHDVVDRKSMIASSKCGGYLAQNIYGTGIGRKAENKAELVDTRKFMMGQYKDARIAFVLTLNGRAIRQVDVVKLLTVAYDIPRCI